MSYTVLARRYRSNSFDELIGQDHIAQTLTNAIETNRIAHAFLFTGTRGTGKTSSARILAKCLNCEKSDKPTAKPCGKCNSCQAIARGEDIDVIEIDAASNTGVDNVREIIENSQFRPARSRFKVYIIDEVHMLSKSAFNALLKTLEEPPEHVKFILATTEVEKVLPTILSRCQRYDFRNISSREIADHLKSVCKKEKIKADDDAILLVAKAGAGSMRDALSLLDRLLSAAGDHLTTNTIEQLLGLPKSQQIFDLVDMIGQGDVKTVLTRIDEIITRGLSPETLVSSIIDHFRNLLILKTCGKDNKLVEIPGLQLEDIFNQAQKFDPVVLSQDIVILEELRRQLRFATAGRALIDATMVRLALAAQFSMIEDLLSATSGSSNGTAGAVKKKYNGNLEPGHSSQVEKPVVRNVEDSSHINVAPLAESPSPKAQGPSPDVSEDADSLPAVGKVYEGTGPTSIFAAFKKAGSSKPAPAPQRTVDPANLGPVDRSDFSRLLDQFHAAAMETAPTVAGFLEGGKIVSLESSVVTLEYPKNFEASVRMLDRGGKRESLQRVLSDMLGEEVGLRLSVSNEILETIPVRRHVEPRITEKDRAEPAQPIPMNQGIPITEDLRIEILQNNPLAKSLAEQFNARIVKVE